MVVAFEDTSRGVKPLVGPDYVVSVVGKHPEMPQRDALVVEVTGLG
jgi:hypothetical protein